jgi:hypothetical protein
MEIKVRAFENQLLRAESRLQFLQGQKTIIEKQFHENNNRIKELEIKEDIFQKASTLLQLVSEKTREQSVGRIEAIITQALQEVYGDKNLRFRVIFENKRNIVAAEFKVWDAELKQEINPQRAEAGGIKAIISTILRLVVLDLYHPRVEGPVILDEVGVQISAEHQQRFGKFLQQYSKLTGRQIILISHQDRVQEGADKIIRLKYVNGKSKVID